MQVRCILACARAGGVSAGRWNKQPVFSRSRIIRTQWGNGDYESEHSLRHSQYITITCKHRASSLDSIKLSFIISSTSAFIWSGNCSTPSMGSSGGSAGPVESFENERRQVWLNIGTDLYLAPCLKRQKQIIQIMFYIVDRILGQIRLWWTTKKSKLSKICTKNRTNVTCSFKLQVEQNYLASIGANLAAKTFKDVCLSTDARPNTARKTAMARKQQ